VLVDRLPVHRGGRRLPHPYLIFHSNFNDDLDAYIDAFALVVPWRMRLCWHGIYDFPGPRVVDRFVDFVEERSTPTQHYYSAYPEASSRMVATALELSALHAEFAEAAASLDDEAFVQQWERFVEENQTRL
jgi:hypothetical protein